MWPGSNRSASSNAASAPSYVPDATSPSAFLTRLWAVSGSRTTGRGAGAGFGGSGFTARATGAGLGGGGGSGRTGGGGGGDVKLLVVTSGVSIGAPSVADIDGS